MVLWVASRQALHEYAFRKAGKPSWPVMVSATVVALVSAYLQPPEGWGWWRVAASGLVGAGAGWVVLYLIYRYRAPAVVMGKDFDRLSESYEKVMKERDEARKEVTDLREQTKKELQERSLALDVRVGHMFTTEATFRKKGDGTRLDLCDVYITNTSPTNSVSLFLSLEVINSERRVIIDEAMGRGMVLGAGTLHSPLAVQPQHTKDGTISFIAMEAAIKGEHFLVLYDSVSKQTERVRVPTGLARTMFSEQLEKRQREMVETPVRPALEVAFSHAWMAHGWVDDPEEEGRRVYKVRLNGVKIVNRSERRVSLVIGCVLGNFSGIHNFVNVDLEAAHHTDYEELVCYARSWGTTRPGELGDDEVRIAIEDIVSDRNILALASKFQRHPVIVFIPEDQRSVSDTVAPDPKEGAS